MKTTRRHSPDCFLRRITFVGPLLLALWVLAGCRQKDVVYGLEPIQVGIEFDWQNALGADPEGMTLIFFPVDDASGPWRFDITGREGGDIEIIPGRYRVLAFNSDLPGVEFTDRDSFDSFSAAVRSAGDTLAAPTGILYAADLTGAEIMNSHGKRQVLTFVPDSLSTVYHIRLDSVSGTERIKTAKAVLNGLASSVCLQLKRNSETRCNVVAPLRISARDRSVLETETTGFGNPDIPDPRITLDVIVATSHATYRKSFDVTDQVVNSKYRRNVYINITGLDIPAADTPQNPGGDDVGISVGVDGWQVIEIIYS